MKIIQSKTITLITIIIFSINSFAQTQQDSIIVDGIGQILIDSNQGKIIANISTKEMSADVAITNNNNRVIAVIETLNSVGVNLENIKTSRFSFYPSYIWHQGQRVFDGYQVNISLTISINNIETIGPVLDLIVDAGVTSISSVSFESIDIESFKQQALAKATEDAKLKAQILAQASKVKLGNVINIKLHSNSSFLENNPQPDILPPSVGSGSSIILPEANTIVVRVSIEYLIL